MENDEKQKLISPTNNTTNNIQQDTSNGPKCNKYIVYPIVGSIALLTVVIILIFFISKEL